MRRFYIFILTLLAVGACTTPPEDPDWCYIYDFTQSDYGFNIVEDAGVYIPGTGFVSTLLSDDDELFDGDYTALSISYVEPSGILNSQYVDVTHVQIAMQRPSYIAEQEEINLKAEGTIFGVDFSTIDNQGL
mgnify:CR=1 FL=1